MWNTEEMHTVIEKKKTKNRNSSLSNIFCDPYEKLINVYVTIYTFILVVKFVSNIWICAFEDRLENGT